MLYIVLRNLSLSKYFSIILDSFRILYYSQNYAGILDLATAIYIYIYIYIYILHVAIPTFISLVFSQMHAFIVIVANVYSYYKFGTFPWMAADLYQSILIKL